MASFIHEEHQVDLLGGRLWKGDEIQIGQGRKDPRRTEESRESEKKWTVSLRFYLSWYVGELAYSNSVFCISEMS